MRLIELFDEFQREAIQQEYPTSARVLYDTLLYEFNAAQWAGELAFSERDLIQLTGMPKTTLHEAKHFLASRQYIKITRKKNKTIYSLRRPPSDQQATTLRPVSDREGVVPIEHARADITKNVPSNIHSYLPTDLPTRARACVNKELDEAVAYWERSIGGGKLTVESQSRLAAILSRHDLKWLLSAMDEAASANRDNRGSSPKWLFACIERLENPPKRAVKGGDKGEGTRKSASGDAWLGYD